jgi:hypothetical protein
VTPKSRAPGHIDREEKKKPVIEVENDSEQEVEKDEIEIEMDRLIWENSKTMLMNS